MVSTRAAQAERTRQAVLDTARDLFLEHGFDATSLQHIADTMGVTKANVYYYFKTKIAILEALLAPTVDALTERLDAAERITDRAERIDHLITTWVEQVVTAYRTLAPMSRQDPIVRRHERISRDLDALSERALHLMFGPAPTVDEQAAYWLISDLGVVNRRLTHLSDDDLRATLTRLCRRVVGDLRSGTA
ncbi:TetR/AcrR family transcriptional regulator [Amycolatopsis sp. OK19-0408]|uniref:TetR/AcrR family transcriptional regulator n=1 Tax=Amycolatopsis iheyensis TaxID=2945988 RepID=A0A9X2NFN2_9PSEU|nr:TetR/AcrR family transcriptional regulator [Amycolatopsis iheyensis]MCR6487859.1 TetR/AcrR family transcriptional regulator [Amycolatopsis iheyensis]